MNILTKETSQGSKLATSVMELFATIVYGWTLLTVTLTKSSIVDLAGHPRHTSFASNLKALKRYTWESIAMSAKLLEIQLPNSCHPYLKHIIKSL